jgi:hypothetical protein
MLSTAGITALHVLRQNGVNVFVPDVCVIIELGLLEDRCTAIGVLIDAFTAADLRARTHISEHFYNLVPWSHMPFNLVQFEMHERLVLRLHNAALAGQI